jgi:hypothetical protein
VKVSENQKHFQREKDGRSKVCQYILCSSILALEFALNMRKEAEYL